VEDKLALAIPCNWVGDKRSDLPELAIRVTPKQSEVARYFGLWSAVSTAPEQIAASNLTQGVAKRILVQ
jgi:hypothetical protein